MSLLLDHVGYAGSSLAALRGAMLRLGFAPTGPRELQAALPDGSKRSLGQSSCHIVLRSGYVELTEVARPADGHHLEPWLGSGDGLKILALGTAEVEARYAACVAAGLRCTEPARATREIDYGSRQGAARFCWFMLAAAETPEGLLCFVRNETPELVYQDEVSEHPNTALALAEVVVACDDPRAVAARYSRALGVGFPAEPGAQAIPVGGGAIRFADAEALERRFGPAMAAAPGRFAAIVIDVRDLEATERVLDAAGVGFHRRGGELVVGAADAAGAAIAFREGGLVYPAGPQEA